MLGFFPAAPISVESNGIAVKALVQELARQSGQPLQATAALAADRLVVRFNQITVSDAMKAIAKVEVGTWSKSGDTVFLEPDAPERRRLDAELRSNLVKGWEAKIQKMEALAGPEDYTAAVAQSIADRYRRQNQDHSVAGFLSREETDVSKPMGRALTRLMRAIGPEELAGNPDGVVEYATNPTSLQLPIGQDGKEILEKLQAEEGIWESGNRVAESKIAGATGLILQLTTHFYRPGGIAFLKAYDASGRIVEEEVTPANLGSPSELAEEEKQEREIQANPHWVEVPNLCTQLYRIRDERIPRGLIPTWWKTDPEFKAAILHPEKVDYLASTFGSMALAMAKDANENLLIPESYAYGRYLTEGSVKDGKFNANALRASLKPERTDFDLPNWFLIRPSISDQERAEVVDTIDPQALGEFSRGVDGSGRIELESVADLMKNSLSAFGVETDLNLIAIVQRNLKDPLQGFGWFNAWMPAIEFYGRLDPDRRKLARDTGIDLASLSPDNWAPVTRKPNLMGQVHINSLKDGGAETIYSDPFVFFASDMSKHGALHISDSEVPSMRAGGDGWGRYYTASEYAAFLKGGELEPTPTTSFRPGQRRTVKLMFDFDGKASLTMEIACDDPTGPSVTHFQDLPKDFQQDFHAN